MKSIEPSDEILIEYRVPLEHAGFRLDRVLVDCPRIISRSQAAKLISMGKVSSQGVVLKASYKPKCDELLQILIPPPVPSELVPYAFDLEVLYEDEALMVINKPAGLVVHPAHGHAQDTLVNALIHMRKDLSLGFQKNRPGLVHRLDRDTSGVLVIAKNDLAQVRLAAQFEKKTAHRRYRALVFGKFKEEVGRIESWLARHPNDRKKFASLKEAPAEGQKAKRAVTHYAVIDQADQLALVELRLETGRTHQIRVHLSEASHPILGDEVYGGVKRGAQLKSVKLRNLLKKMTRFCLHAYELGFSHPSTGEWMMFRAPWPLDLQELLELSQLKWRDENYEFE